jgi:nitrate/TMAO reductase-like tetraheme cytochrome c subunit
MRVHRLHLLLLGAIFALAALFAGVAMVSYKEQDNDFCASCHTQPETDYVARFKNAVAQNNARDLAALHHRKKEIRCIDCHVGEGWVGRAQVLAIAAWDALKHYAGIARQPAVIVVPVQNEACAKCHAATLTRRGFDNHEHNKLSDRDAPFIRCADCHVTHRQGDERNVFQFREAIFRQCEYCHVEMGKGPRGLQ